MIDNDSPGHGHAPPYAESGQGTRGANSQSREPGRDGPNTHFDRDQAEREARDAIGRARNELQELLENQKNVAAGQVKAVAGALRGTADELHDKNQTTVAAYVGHVADRIEHWSGRLRARHIESLGEDIRHFANRQPVLFFAGAVIIGFAAARFLTSTNDGDAAADTSYRATGNHAAATPPPAYGISHNE